MFFEGSQKVSLKYTTLGRRDNENSISDKPTPMQQIKAASQPGSRSKHDTKKDNSAGATQGQVDVSKD